MNNLSDRPSFTLYCGRTSLELGRKTAIMGILNVTPDSFADGGLYYNNTERALKRAEAMIGEGADVIDVGGESTRPGSEPVSVQEELARIIPVIKALRKSLGESIIISIDTYKAAVAEQALTEGADVVNSLGGLQFDPDLIQIVKQYQCPVILYHVRGQPKTMQVGEITYADVLQDIRRFFEGQIELALSQGVPKNRLLIDPGIGFGKKAEQNLTIISRLWELSALGLPIVIGVSRKKHLGLLLQEALRLQETPSVADRLEASLAETAVAVLNGAHMVRTHDVLQTKKFLVILDALRALA